MINEQVIHPLEPIYNSESKILILGTMPSKKSRELSFYYAHPRNRFWTVMQMLFKETAETSADKTALLLRHNIALWDVVYSCDIFGSADSSIKNVVANDLSRIIANSKIDRVFTTGKTAYKLYNKYQLDKTGITAVCLPSTSPANAGITLDELIQSYSNALIIKNS